MPTITVRPTPVSVYSFGKFAGLMDWALSNANVSNQTPTGFTLSGNYTGKATVATLKGVGLTYDSFGLVNGGTLTALSFSFNGIKQGDVSGAVGAASVRSAMLRDVNGTDIYAIENLFMGFNWVYHGTERNETAPFGSRVGDGALFNLRGNDTIYLNGGHDNFYTGNGNDKLDGGRQNDILNSGFGNDTVTGGLNNDYFDFTTQFNRVSNVDRLTDFNPAYDIIRLDNAIFKKLGPVGTLQAIFFKAGSGAADANDYVIYNRGVGGLYYDPDGNGPTAPILIAALPNKPVISNLDFAVI